MRKSVEASEIIFNIEHGLEKVGLPFEKRP
jgi:hypothetical protein